MDLERRKKANKNLQEDLENDIQIMFEYFIKDPTVHRLSIIPDKFDLIRVSQTTHFKKKEYLLEFFWKITQEIYESSRTLPLKFVLCIMIMHYIFFHQSSYYVRVPIYAEKLEVINRCLQFYLENDGPHQNDLFRFAGTCLNELKLCNGFVVYYDIYSMCLDDQLTKDIEIQISKCNSDLDNLSNELLTKFFDKEK